jgi:predicted outer membrane protein
LALERSRSECHVFHTRSASDGDNPDLKAWATATLPSLKHHLDMAKALEAKD